MPTVDELVIRIKADATQLERELRRVGSITQQEATRMTGAFSGLRSQLLALAPALSVAALATLAKRSIDAAGRMKDLGVQIDFAASTLSALEPGLVATGSSVEQFATSINLMNANIGQAASGNEQLAEAFSRLGLLLDDLKKLSPEEQFYAIADALTRVGTQYEQTELGRAIFGRGFANLIPLIKEANGNLDEHVRRLKDTGDALSQETIDRIDAFGDALANAGIKAKNAFLEAFAAILKVNDSIADSFGRGAPGALTQARLGNVPGMKTGPEYGPVHQAEQFGPAYQTPSRPAPRSAATTLKATAAAAKEVNRTQDEARRLTERNMSAFEKYEASRKRASELFAERAITEETYQRELIRLQQDLNAEIGDGTEKAAEQATISAKLIKDSFADALESAMFNFENFGDSVSGILEGIARNIARKRIIDPLSDSIGGLFDGLAGDLDLGDLFGGFFADGGRPPTGRPSIVGERGPEIFVPDTAGTVVPNHAVGGVSVTNVFNISPGIQGTVQAEIRRVAPDIVAAAQAGTLAAIQKGGKAAQIVGVRS